MGDLAAAYPRGTRTRGNQMRTIWGPDFVMKLWITFHPQLVQRLAGRFIMLAQETEPCGSVRLTRSLKHPRDARNNKGTPTRQFQPRALRRAGFIDGSDPAYPGPRSRLRTAGRRLVSIDRSGGDRGDKRSRDDSACDWSSNFQLLRPQPHPRPRRPDRRQRPPQPRPQLLQ